MAYILGRVVKQLYIYIYPAAHMCICVFITIQFGTTIRVLKVMHHNFYSIMIDLEFDRSVKKV